MSTKKRPLEESNASRKIKRIKVGKDRYNLTAQPDILVQEEVDFPRGGGTSLTPQEVKAVRAEGIKEADEELFKSPEKPFKKKRSNAVARGEGDSRKVGKSGMVRGEYLNYKRMDTGMKILGQIISIQPLALIISLPNQLFGHVTITNISSELTALLDGLHGFPDGAEDSAEEEENPTNVPDLSEMFHEGQYVRCIVVAVHAIGLKNVSVISKSRDDLVKVGRRVELSVSPVGVNAGIQKADLKPGFTLTAAVKSKEDHGYILNLGISEVSGFVPFDKLTQGISWHGGNLHDGQLLDVTVKSISPNGQICTVNADAGAFTSSSLSDVVNVSSILPGELVQALVTAVEPGGLKVQILGFFDGTIDQVHMPHFLTKKPIKVGDKVKARVLYSSSTSPPRFALSLAEHVVHLHPKHTATSVSSQQSIQEAYPIGSVLEEVRITRIESERGVYTQVEPGLEGFVHISHISDDHVPSLFSTGPWKVGSIHRARVIGHFAFDGFLQLSFKNSVLEQRFMQVAEIQVGEVIKGTVKKLTDTGLFVTISSNIDGIIWPNHYADILLKHPAKRFKPGDSIKCRVLLADPERKRICLTAKKTLVDSKLPILSKFDAVKSGMVTHAVVFKVEEKHLLVEFYNNLKALVPLKEVSETPLSNIRDSFPVGRVVQVRILTIEPERQRFFASIKQAAPNYDRPVVDTSAVEIGNIAKATVVEVHRDNVALTLQPTGVKALLSLKNLANRRALPVPQLRSGIRPGDELEDLVVVSRNEEKGFVIVANAPKAKVSSKNSLIMESIAAGQIVGGRVIRHIRHGTLIKISSSIGGLLHPTDVVDDYEAATPFPALDSILRAAVVGVDLDKKQLTLSTRHSRLHPDRAQAVVDREIQDIGDLHVGETVRGYIKSISEHGLFITIGRGLDARVQIRELFDEYVKEWQGRFTVNQLVKGRILSVDLGAKKIEMSFRTVCSKANSSRLTVGDLQVGQKVNGMVKRIEAYGLFVEIEGSKFSGLCHKSELSDNKDADVAVALRGFMEGDRVKAIITKIENRKISLSLKPSHFNEDDFEGRDTDAEVGGSTKESLGVHDNDIVMSPLQNDPEVDNGGEQADTSEDEDTMHVDEAHFFRPSTMSGDAHSSSVPSAVTSLDLAGFQWSEDRSHIVTDMNLDSSDEEYDPDNKPSRKKRKRREIEQDITADMQTKMPESNADFERVLLGSPDSSFLWIQYMSFQLQLSEVDRARVIARRAIRAINFREEQEKLNVWIALLNLECVYGTDATLESVFKEAAKANDSKTVHLRLASILDKAGKVEKAEEQYKRTSKKFGQSSKVWSLFGEYHLEKGNLEEARMLLPRSLQSLEKRKHLKTISRFAQLEYKYGEPERGKTLFEGILDSHPKRLDLWSVYMDMEAGQGGIQCLRNLFERVLALKMTNHKAKFFFKKWLQLERRIGDEEGAENVKQKAFDWTQQANGS